jgi:hypothetical protein
MRPVAVLCVAVLAIAGQERRARLLNPDAPDTTTTAGCFA